MFRHEAMFYDGPEGFLAGAVPFVRAGLDAGEPVMVAVREERLGPLREALGADAKRVVLADMAQLGRNPARIIPAWRAFQLDHGAPPAMRGIGEPIWADRRGAELVECQRHESLLNLAFADTDGFRLLCPYDTANLGEAVLHEARCSHPYLADGEPCPQYRGPDDAAASPLAPPPERPDVLSFHADTLDEVRALAGRRAEAAGMTPQQAGEFALAAHELAINSIRHGGGFGVLRLWDDGAAVVCEVRDRGHIDDPLVGRRTPRLEEPGGWGLWIANQVCDLVEVRSDASGTVVRARLQAT